MSGLEDAVKEQLNAAHANLLSWQRQEDATAEDLGAAFGRLGRLLHAYELYDAAEACYRNTSALMPNDFHWPYYLGYVYQKKGRLADAVTAYRRALALDERNVAARVHLGEVLEAQNLSTEAETELKKALEINSQIPVAYAILGEIALARGEHQTAVELLSAVLTAVPAANRLHYPLAMAYRGIGDVEKAKSHLGQSGSVGLTVADPLIDELEQLATGERVYLLRGRQAFAAGRYGEAAGEFRKAMAADPKSGRVRVNLGSALGQMGDVLGAMEQYRAALGIDPANVAAHFNLGLLLVQQGELESAAGAFQAAIDAKYDDAEAHRQLGLTLRRLGRHEESETHLKEGFTLAPRNEDAHLDYAVLMVDLGRYEEARETLEFAHGLMPQAGGIAHALARILAGCPDLELRDGPRALGLAQRVYEASQTPGHAVTVAQALAEIGRCSEAAEWLGRLIAVAVEEGAGEWAAAQQPALERYQAGPPCR